MNPEGLSNVDMHERMQDRLERQTAQTAEYIHNGINQLANTHTVYQYSATKTYQIAVRQERGPETPFTTKSTGDKDEAYTEHEGFYEAAQYEEAVHVPRQLTFTEDAADDSLDWLVATENLLASNTLILELSLLKDFSSFVKHLGFLQSSLERLLELKFEQSLLPSEQEFQKITTTMLRCRLIVAKTKAISAFWNLIDTQITKFISLIFADKVNDPTIQEFGKNIIARIKQYVKKIDEDDFSPLKAIVSKEKQEINVKKEPNHSAPPASASTKKSASSENLPSANASIVNTKRIVKIEKEDSAPILIIPTIVKQEKMDSPPQSSKGPLAPAINTTAASPHESKRSENHSVKAAAVASESREGKKRTRAKKEQDKGNEDEKPANKHHVPEQNAAVPPTRVSARLRNQKSG